MKLLFSSRFKFNQNWGAVILLFVITAGLFWRSYVPGTFLMGWDSVMSEFNLGLAWQRAIGGLWQEFQGLGLQGGHGYVTDLVRLPWLWLLSALLPLSLVRYAIVYLMWLLGIVGSYVLIKKLVNRPVIGLVGGLMYGLHPFTIQNFFVIHDAFGWLFMCLPWSVWLLLLILEKPSKKKWIAWLGFQFLASFIGFIPPAFLGYGLTLALIGLLSKQWRRGLVALVLMGIANAYWLLPFGYYTVTGSNTYVNSKLNQMTTEHNALISQSFGRVTDLILGKGFYYESLDWMGTETRPILGEWIEWWNRTEVKAGLLVVVIMMMVGLIFGRNNHKRILMTAFGVIVVILVVPNIFRFVPLLGQAFRIPFTKISFEYVLLLSVFASLGLDFVYRKFKSIGWLVMGSSVVVLGLISWPLINGRFFYDKMRVHIPNEYFQVMEYLRKEDDLQRIAALPVQSYNGWYIQSWNYTGSGFLFYGIGQPILDRAFDVWSPYNETFYNELSTAFYYCPVDAADEQLIQCAQNVKQIFDKYQVSLVLLDESVILPGQDQSVMRYELWKRVLAKLDPEPDFESGSLILFSTSEESLRPPSEEENQHNLGGVVSAPAKYREIEADTTYGRFDPFFDKDVAYVQRNLGGYVSYPFADITKENLSDKISYPENELVRVASKVKQLGEGKVVFPELAHGDMLQGRIRATLSDNELLLELLPFGELSVGDQHFPLWLDKKLEVELPDLIQAIKIEVNGTLMNVQLNQPTELRGFIMLAGEPLSVNVFEAEGRAVNISSQSAQLGKLAAGQLISTQTDRAICLGFEQTNYACLNRGNLLVTPQDGIYWLDVVDGKEGLLPQVTVYQSIANYQFEAGMWQEMKREFEVGAGEVGWETVISPREVGSLKLEDNSNNCDVLKRGSAQKKYSEGGILYEASEYGAYCDSWWLAPIDSEGILRFTGENLLGRGIKMSLYSSLERRTILERLFPSGGTFDQSLAYITGLSQGSTLNIETKSFGSIGGINRLDSVKVYSLPLTWLQKIKIGGSEAINESTLKVGTVKKWGTGIYKVEVSGGGLLILNQGFDKGWISPGLDHVAVNGWSNGWIIPADSGQQTVNSADLPAGEAGHGPLTTVVLIYWPQVLEWLGLGLLGVGGGWFAFNILRPS